jgi:tetratricopeptide (TPR) repeat protein
VGSWILPNTYYYLAEAALRMGRAEDALEAARTSLALAKTDGSPEYIGAAYRALGMVSKQLGRPVSVSPDDGAAFEACDGEYFFTKSLKILEEGNMDGELARTLREWARYEFRDGHQDRGIELWKEARDIFGRLGAQMEVERMEQPPPASK